MAKQLMHDTFCAELFLAGELSSLLMSIINASGSIKVEFPKFGHIIMFFFAVGNMCRLQMSSKLKNSNCFRCTFKGDFPKFSHIQ